MAATHAYVISAVGHAIAIAALAQAVDRCLAKPAVDRQPAPAAASTVIDVVTVVRQPAEQPAMAVEWVASSSEVREPAALPPTPIGASRDRAAAIAVDHGNDTTTPAKPPGGHSLLSMRGDHDRGPIDFSIGPEAAARMEQPSPHATQPAASDDGKPTGKIQPRGAAGRINDAVTTVTVHPDGTVDLKDKPDFDIRFRLPIPRFSAIKQSLRDFGNDVVAWQRDPYRDTHVGTVQDLPRHQTAVPNACSHYDDPFCDGGQASTTMLTEVGEGAGIPILSGRLGISDWLHRKFIGDPHSARKLKLLDDTRAERVASGARYRNQQQNRSAELMARNLEALWQATHDPAERRRALFELWDECGEGDGPTGEAGQRARAMVIGWIQSHLPRGAADGYSDSELAELASRRSSKQPFAPYAE